MPEPDPQRPGPTGVGDPQRPGPTGDGSPVTTIANRVGWKLAMIE